MKSIQLISFALLTVILLTGCNMAGNDPQNIPPVSTPEAAQEAATAVQIESPSPEVVAAEWPSNMIAYYPLTSDFADSTGNNSPAAATIGSPSPDGVFCNASCDVSTPRLNGFDFNSFTIQAEFLIQKNPYSHDAVFVGGLAPRWTSFGLLPDGEIVLIHNSTEQTTCSVKYQTNVWHEAAITYNGTTLKLYLDGIEGCSVDAVLETGAREIGDQNSILLHDNGYDSSFSGNIKNLKVYNTVEVPQARIPQAGNATLPDTTLAPADIILGSCPTESELAAIDADLNLEFESDPSAGTLVCTTAAGSRDLTSFKRIVYTTLLVMKKLEFTQPLPWTDKQLYTWLTDTIDGIRFRSDIENSFCCEPAGVINIQNNNLSASYTNKWIDPQTNTGANGLLLLFVHEARHVETGSHTCGNNDNTRIELGAWGVQYYLQIYLADNLKDPAFLTIPSPGLADYYSKTTREDAESMKSFFCQDQ